VHVAVGALDLLLFLECEWISWYSILSLQKIFISLHGNFAPFDSFCQFCHKKKVRKLSRRMCSEMGKWHAVAIFLISFGWSMVSFWFRWPHSCMWRCVFLLECVVACCSVSWDAAGLLHQTVIVAWLCHFPFNGWWATLRKQHAMVSMISRCVCQCSRIFSSSDRCMLVIQNLLAMIAFRVVSWNRACQLCFSCVSFVRVLVRTVVWGLRFECCRRAGCDWNLAVAIQLLNMQVPIVNLLL